MSDEQRALALASLDAAAGLESEGDGPAAMLYVGAAQARATLAVAEELAKLREIVQGLARVTAAAPLGEDYGREAGIRPRALRLDTVLVDPHGILP